MKSKLNILIVDDEKVIVDSLGGIFQDEGHRVIPAYSGKQAITEILSHDIDAIFLDVWMPEMDGIETLQRIKEINKNIPIIVMSGHGTIETAVKVTKLGAMDFLEKPLVVDKIFDALERVREQKERSKNIPSQKKFEIIGQSQSIQDVRDMIQRIAQKKSWVLITGENGTGKEVVAKKLHQLSERSTQPFIAVNCAAIPDELIESELFGFTKGAFTHATHNRKGRFELAHNGTIFLDEIGDMSLRTQAKILRILEEKKFERLGDEQTIEVNVRVIAATNKNLLEEIKSGNFREDLYFRLNIIPIHLDPLRERKEDIPLFCDYFLRLVAEETEEEIKTFHPLALKALQEYSWPGNVRELKNLIERLSVTVSSKVIDLSHLPITIISSYENDSPHSNMEDFKSARAEFERNFIILKLTENDWNISKTAEKIGIERTHFHRKMKSLGIEFKGKE